MKELCNLLVLNQFTQTHQCSKWKLKQICMRLTISQIELAK